MERYADECDVCIVGGGPAGGSGKLWNFCGTRKILIKSFHRNVHCHKVEAAGERGRRRGQCWSSHHNLVPVLSPLPTLMVSDALSRNFSIYVLPIPIPGVPCVCDRKGFICGRSHLVWGLP